MAQTTPMRAIRQKCLDCCCGQAQEVRLCTVKKCALHPYRMGHRPKVDKLHPEDNSDEKTSASPTIFEFEGHSENEEE